MKQGVFQMLAWYVISIAVNHVDRYVHVVDVQVPALIFIAQPYWSKYA